MEKVTAKITQGEFKDKSMSIDVDFDAILGRTSSEVKKQRLIADLRISVQDILRSAIKAEKSAADVTKNVNKEWVPGTKRVGKPKSEKMLDDFLKLTDEERANFLKEANQ